MNGWQELDPYPDYPAIWSLSRGRVLVACRAYLAGQFRLQVSVHELGAYDILAPEL